MQVDRTHIQKMNIEPYARFKRKWKGAVTFTTNINLMNPLGPHSMTLAISQQQNKQGPYRCPILATKQPPAVYWGPYRCPIIATKQPPAVFPIYMLYINLEYLPIYTQLFKYINIITIHNK